MRGKKPSEYESAGVGGITVGLAGQKHKVMESHGISDVGISAYWPRRPLPLVPRMYRLLVPPIRRHVEWQ